MICVELPHLVAIAEKRTGLAFPAFRILNHSL